VIDPADGERLERRVSELEGLMKLYVAHVENLIERVYELEETTEAMKPRLRAVERATPLKRPKPPPPSTGPVR
jgi:hypothetical protein